MSSPLLQTAALIFVTVAAASLVTSTLWERHERRRQWARAAARLKEFRGPAQEAAASAPLVLQAGPASGPWAALMRLPAMRRAETLLEQAAVTWGVRGWALRAAGFGFGAALIGLLVSPLLALPAALIGAALPWLQLRRVRAARLARFEASFPDAVDLLSRAIRAGHPLTAGLKMVADEAPTPIREEFRRVFDEQKFGLSLQESLEGLARRVDLLDVRIFATAVNIQREVGGNLAEILDQIAETIRERFKIVRQVRTFTAQGRMTGLLLGALPIGLGFLLTIINPEYMLVLFREPGGRLLLGAAATLQLIGFGVVRRVTRIEV